MNAEPRRRTIVLETLAVFACFLSYSLVQAPIPGINEPHYLTKAKHFWDASYAPGDFFLDSSNPHFVFYVAIGPLTRFLSLEQTALVGRCLSLLVLAVGWTSLFRRCLPRLGSSFALAGLFLGYTSWQIEWCRWNGFSGEWIVGGVESKVFAWGFLLWSLASFLTPRIHLAALLLGLSISFHPVIGIWGGLSLVLAWWFLPNRAEPNPFPRGSRLRPLLLLAISALPGLIPAVLMVLERHPDGARANEIQVVQRLGHHLDPLRFPLTVYLLYGALIGIWLAGSLFLRNRAERDAATNDAQRLWLGFVLGSIVIACGGIVVGLLRLASVPESVGNLVLALMKFYPFRLADILVPLAALMTIVDFATVRRPARAGLTIALLGVGCLGLGAGLWPELRSRNPERFAANQKADWIDICRWIDEQTPADALVIAPQSELTLKWYASRGSYVSHKDAPQDAAGLLEWLRRKQVLSEWYQRNYADESYSRAELAELSELTGATILIARRLGPLEIEPAYRNSSYRVYLLPQRQTTKPSGSR